VGIGKVRRCGNNGNSKCDGYRRWHGIGYSNSHGRGGSSWQSCTAPNQFYSDGKFGSLGINVGIDPGKANTSMGTGTERRQG